MAILSNNALDFISNSVEQTIRLGIRLGELMQAGDLVRLNGQMGAGKTAFVRGLGRGWGTAVRVTSPTYAIVNVYPRTLDGVNLYHVDGYRLQGEADVFSTGLEDLLDEEAAFVVEWPQNLGAILPESGLTINWRYVSETRRGLHFSAQGERAQTLLAAFRKSAFGI